MLFDGYQKGWCTIPSDKVNHSEQGSQRASTSTKLQVKQASNKKGLKRKNTKSINTSDVHHHYNLRSQQSRNKEVNRLKDDA